MKKSKKISTILLALLVSISLFVPSTMAAPQQTNFSGKLSYAFPGAGWGSVTYDFGNVDDYSYNLTYKLGTTVKREAKVRADYGCPFTCEIRWTNKYYNSSNNSYIGGVTHLEYKPGSYWTSYEYVGTTKYINAKSFSSTTGNHLNFRTTIGFFAYNGGWVYGSANDHYGNLR